MRTHDPNDPQVVLHAMAVHLLDTATDMGDLLPPTPHSMSSEQLRIATALVTIKRESARIIATLTGEETGQ